MKQITELRWRNTQTDKPVERKTKLLYIPEHDMTITGYRVNNLYFTPLGTYSEGRVTMWAELPTREDFKDVTVDNG